MTTETALREVTQHALIRPLPVLPFLLLAIAPQDFESENINAPKYEKRGIEGKLGSSGSSSAHG
jgi:hypothetical protein